MIVQYIDSEGTHVQFCRSTRSIGQTNMMQSLQRMSQTSLPGAGGRNRPCSSKENLFFRLFEVKSADVACVPRIFCL